ncbi:hypothetical protein [Ammoniphilus sp. 3BR4]|uniref:hypothetical protein n=1 Tax=Ammoniphilus sp. 3BR4 TaxID=3158265 RepID=UPI003465CFB6
MKRKLFSLSTVASTFVIIGMFGGVYLTRSICRIFRVVPLGVFGIPILAVTTFELSGKKQLQREIGAPHLNKNKDMREISRILLSASAYYLL